MNQVSQPSITLELMDRDELKYEIARMVFQKEPNESLFIMPLYGQFCSKIKTTADALSLELADICDLKDEMRRLEELNIPNESVFILYANYKIEKPKPR
tara:strand:+ start:892 stop:1188 length:297 start_codon:yes stop_codon:yes gene_type:complete